MYRRSTDSSADACYGSGPVEELYSNDVVIELGSVVYRDSVCSVAARGGYYSNGFTWFRIEPEGVTEIGDCQLN